MWLRKESLLMCSAKFITVVGSKVELLASLGMGYSVWMVAYDVPLHRPPSQPVDHHGALANGLVQRGVRLDFSQVVLGYEGLPSPRTKHQAVVKLRQLMPITSRKCTRPKKDQGQVSRESEPVTSPEWKAHPTRNESRTNT